ncbi:MAG: hypothetical protein ACE5LH_08595, partial [Fidelibacterota bacterium]
ITNPLLQGWDEATFGASSVNDPPYLVQSLPDVSIQMNDFGAVIIARLEDYFSDVDTDDHLVFAGEALD